MTALGFPAFPPRPGRRGRSWWAREFVAAMEETALHLTLLKRGRRFAGSGRIGPITVSPGRIGAVVDDPDGTFAVEVHVGVLDDAAWDRLLDQVAAEAGHLAALVEGELPRSLVESAAAAGVDLLPTVGDLESECGCPDVGDPCQHAAALCYQVAWLLDDDPFVLTLLRGRDRAALVGELVPRAVPPAGEPATDAFAREVQPLPLPGPVPARTTATTVPPAPGLPVDLLPALVTAAAARARAMLG
ncbi:SWIM zinc finger family protein [Pseudonocardia sp. CA-107938]|uniref:SWIM zinc finger family protein n=1 Tax=Pseudonocardia sp. CA-107938 TaxID=3240021 RepID=UPI003D9103CA